MESEPKVYKTCEEDVLSVSPKEHRVLWLDRTRTVSGASKVCHIYLPTELKGERVIGLILK